MVRFLFGTGLPRKGEREVRARTLGEALDELRELEPWLEEADLRFFVGGVDAERLEGAATPVGDEDTVLVAAL